MQDRRIDEGARQTRRVESEDNRSASSFERRPSSSVVQGYEGSERFPVSSSLRSDRTPSSSLTAAPPRAFRMEFSPPSSSAQRRSLAHAEDSRSASLRSATEYEAEFQAVPSRSDGFSSRSITNEYLPEPRSVQRERSIPDEYLADSRGALSRERSIPSDSPPESRGMPSRERSPENLPQRNRGDGKDDVARRWLSAADDALKGSKMAAKPVMPYRLNDHTPQQPPKRDQSDLRTPTTRPASKQENDDSAKRKAELRSTIAEIDTDDEEEDDRFNHKRIPPSGATNVGREGERQSPFKARLMSTSTTTTLPPPSASKVTATPRRTDDTDDEQDDDERDVVSTAQRKAERFMNAAATVLNEDKILEQDPSAFNTSSCRVLLRSFRGTYLRKTSNSTRAVTGGSPFDFANCEFLVEKHSQIPSKVLMFGDTVFLKLASENGWFLSGTEFTREARGTWTIRRFVTAAAANEASEERRYICSSDAIVLEYDSNRRILGSPAPPHDSEASSYASLEVSPLEASQCWYLVRSNSIATSFEVVNRSNDVVLAESTKPSSSLAYMLDLFLGLYPASMGLERDLNILSVELSLIDKAKLLLKDIDFLRSYARARSMQMEWGRVAHALCHHLQVTVLDPFDEFISGLYVVVATNPPTMTYLFNAIQPRCRILLDWARALLPAQFLRGGMLLNALNNSKMGCFESRAVCEEALQASCAPYLESLERWMSQGEIFDPFDEFLVKENTKLNQVQLSTDYNARYWNHKYVLREEKHIPWFLKRHAKLIIKTGRDLDAIRSSRSNRSLLVRRSNVAIASPSSLLKHDALVEAHSKASRELLQVLREHSIFQRLDFLKKFFLLEKGDFFAYFMDVAGTDLRKQVGVKRDQTLLANRLGTLTQVSMREREIFDPFLDDLSCVLLPYAVDTHVEKIHQTINSHDELQFPQDGSELPSFATAEEEQQIIGVEDILLCVDSFALDYTPAWPVSIVLPRRVMTKYQLLFRHLFRCKHAERRICSAWLDTRSGAMADDDLVAQSLILRMTQFLQSLEYYTTFEVIEPRWRDFLGKAQQSVEIDDLLRAHEDFLDSCLRECLLTNPVLIRGLSRLLRLCLSLGDLLLHEDAQIVPVKCDPIRVSEFDQELVQFLASLAEEAERGQYKSEHLANLATRLDFSAFYSMN